jgi:thiol-disulfide isomerase/thioredoxin
MIKTLLALATLTLLASCTMPGAQTPTPTTPTQQMAPDAMMPKAETMPKVDTMMPDDKMMSGTMDTAKQMADQKMPDAMPLPYPNSGAVALDTLERPADTMPQTDTMMKKESGYKTYTPELVASALASGQRVALFFHATWCPSCKALDRAITVDLGSIGSDTLIVTQHTTVVLNTDGSAKSKKLGARTVAEVLGQ